MPIQEMAGYGEFTRTEEQTDREILYSAHGLTKKGGFAFHLPTAGRASDGVLESGQVMTLLENGYWAAYGDTAAADEVVTLTEGTAITAGTFTLSFGGDTTGDINFDDTAAEIETALEALPSIGPGNVTVTGGPIGSAPVVITFVGALGDQDVGAVTSDQTDLTGTFTIAVTTPGTSAGGTAHAILANGVDVSDRHQAINVYFRGTFKTDMLIGLDAAAITDLKIVQNTQYGWSRIP